MSAETMGSGSPTAASLRQQASAWWTARTQRERQMVAVVVFVLVAFAIWVLLVQPPLRVAREAPEQLDRLEAQYQQMQRVAAESATLRGAPRVTPTQAVTALKAATDRLGGNARLALQSDRATLTVTGVSPDALRAWLVEARNGARARPVEAQLQRAASGYNGTLSMTIGGGS